MGEFLLAVLRIGGQGAPALAIALERLGIGAHGVVVVGAGSDRIERLRNLPHQPLFHGRLLVEPRAIRTPAETRAEGSVALVQVDRLDLPVLREFPAQARCHQRGPGGGGAVAVHAGDRRRGARLDIEQAVAVDIVEEMAIDALHSEREVDVLHVNGLPELVLVVVGDFLPILGQQVALPVFLEHRAEHPAVAMIVGELGFLELGVQLGDLFEEIHIAPQPARCGGLGIAPQGLRHFLVGGILLLRGIHVLRIRFLIPPGVAEEGIHKQVSLVHVAGHALARRDAAGELVLDRVPLFLLGNHRIGIERKPLVAVCAVPAGVGWRAVVRINYVTCSTSARPVIPRPVVRSEEIQQGIVEAGLVRPDDHRIDAGQGSEAAIREALQGPARRFVRIRVSEIEGLAAAFLEDPVDISGLPDVEARQRENLIHDPHLFHLLLGVFDRAFEGEGNAIGAVCLAEDRVLRREGAVVVGRRAPEHRTVAHHAVADVVHLLRMAVAAGSLRHAEVTGIHELDELLGLVVEQDGAVARVRGAFEKHRIAGPYVRLPHRQAGGGIAAMAIRATQAHELAAMGIVGVFMAVDAPAALRHLGRLRLVHLVGFRDRSTGVWDGFLHGDRRPEEAAALRLLGKGGQGRGDHDAGEAERDGEGSCHQKVMVAPRKPL